MFASGKTAAVASVANYIEEVFSTYLYTGNSSTQTITNGIDLSTKGGLVWQKDRSQGTGYHHILQDTARGATNCLFTNLTNAQSQDSAGTGFVFNNNGFTIGTSNVKVNASGDNYTSWTFRKQPKFFDVVTWTGDGNAKTISHSLGSTPGCIIIKATSTTSSWGVYHRSVTGYGLLDLTNAWTTPSIVTATTNTTFSIIAGWNDPGVTYVAYLFAHDAGGFGLTGTDNVISCGSFTTDGSGNATVNLGYEPQFIIDKPSSTTGNWDTFDVMRGWVANTNGTNQKLNPNLANAEVGSNYIFVNSTGFTVLGAAASTTYIYIAIRRGPMKVPTSGTSVFSPNISSGTTGTVITTNFPVDMQIGAFRSIAQPKLVVDRLRGVNTSPVDTGIPYLNTTSTAADTSGAYSRNWGNTGFEMPLSRDSTSNIFWNFQRAPSFFDEVCYTGTGVTHTETHNLGVAPELIIVKRRASATASWAVYAAPLTASYVGFLDLTNAFQADNMWNSTAPTSTAFTVRAANAQVNASGSTYVAYLFATCAGVSKVGSYTGTGTTLQVNCGFTGGARFVLIKRTDSTGDWYVWDTARGIVSGNDPYLLLNSTAAETTTTDYIDPYSAGFEISSTAPAAINASGGTFIFLAIA